MTIWSVVHDEVGWSVVAERDGERVPPRARLTGLPCITAQVLAAELERAYQLGREDERVAIGREVFA